MRMRTSLLSAVCMAALLTSAASAATLTGAQVTGSLRFGTDTTNYFDPNSTPYTTGLNRTQGTTVTVVYPLGLVEFGYGDGITPITVEFGENGFLFRDYIAVEGGSSPNLTLTFVSNAFLGKVLTETSDSFFGGVVGTLVGNTITVTWGGVSNTLGLPSYSAGFLIEDGPSPVPVPAALPLLAAGLGAIGVFGWRRKPRIGAIATAVKG